MQLVDEQEEQEQPRNGDGQGDAHGRCANNEFVQRRTLAQGCQQAEAHAGDGPQNQRADRHGEGVGEGTEDDVGHVLIGLERFAQARPFAERLGAGSADHPRAEETAQVVEVLDEERLVHAECDAGLRDTFGRAFLPAGGRRRVRRTQLKKTEGDETDRKEEQDQGSGAAKNKTQHGGGCGPPAVTGGPLLLLDYARFVPGAELVLDADDRKVNAAEEVADLGVTDV